MYSVLILLTELISNWLLQPNTAKGLQQVGCLVVTHRKLWEQRVNTSLLLRYKANPASTTTYAVVVLCPKRRHLQLQQDTSHNYIDDTNCHTNLHFFATQVQSEPRKYNSFYYGSTKYLVLYKANPQVQQPNSTVVPSTWYCASREDSCLHSLHTCSRLQPYNRTKRTPPVKEPYTRFDIVSNARGLPFFVLLFSFFCACVQSFSTVWC